MYPPNNERLVEGTTSRENGVRGSISRSSSQQRPETTYRVRVRGSQSHGFPRERSSMVVVSGVTSDSVSELGHKCRAWSLPSSLQLRTIFVRGFTLSVRCGTSTPHPFPTSSACVCLRRQPHPARLVQTKYHVDGPHCLLEAFHTSSLEQWHRNSPSFWKPRIAAPASQPHSSFCTAMVMTAKGCP